MTTDARMALRISCVIFDIDGTLTRTNELIFASFNHVAQKYLHRTYPACGDCGNVRPSRRRELGTDLRKGETPSDHGRVVRFLQHESPRAGRIACRNRGRALVSQEQRSTACRISPAKESAQPISRLACSELAGYFDLVVSGTDVSKHKPDPEGILNVIRTFDLRPQEVLMVGDSLGDIKASRGAG